MGCRAGFEPGAAVQQPSAQTTELRCTLKLSCILTLNKLSTPSLSYAYLRSESVHLVQRNVTQVGLRQWEVKNERRREKKKGKTLLKLLGCKNKKRGPRFFGCYWAVHAFLLLLELTTLFGCNRSCPNFFAVIGVDYAFLAAIGVDHTLFAPIRVGSSKARDFKQSLYCILLAHR